MKPKKKLKLVFLLIFLVQLSFGQEITVTGNVTDESGLPLPGVSVFVKTLQMVLKPTLTAILALTRKQVKYLFLVMLAC
ncbi:hypothetical protein [Flavobacterium piscinae]|uniref:hypothetical protein n=1 Tax=Flavobacterium piscinae TaxID=2506424 RepID=UPI002AAAF18D|nr:hypothetical protein [Flavobacterium piscinae]